MLSDRRTTDGFVLLSVLLVIGIVSALIIATTIAVRSDRADAAFERRLVQATALADAGLTRAMVALRAKEDPLRELLLNESTWVRWRFANQEVLISLIPETSKVDLNVGDPALVVNVLRAVVRDRGKVNRLVRRLDAMRRNRHDLETVRGLLDPADRASSLARDMEAVFTVWTGLRGVDPKTAPMTVLRNLPGLQKGDAELLEQAKAGGSNADFLPFVARFGPLLKADRPVYRARSEVTFDGVTARREALLIYNPSARATWIVFWRDVLD